MPKRCKSKDCNNFVFSNGYCKFHQYLRLDKIVKPKPINKAINKISKKLRNLISEYTELRTEYLKQYPLCKANLDGCTKVSTDIHHMQGRGKFLLNILTWLSVCRNCHKWIEMRPKDAKKLKFSNSRL
jgi:hypothetical protein